jgi:uncharacterized protein YprB with RNaseH-like and TPR domain
MQSLREYDVVRDGNVFGSGFSNTVVLSSEYEQARRTLEGLMERYREVEFDDAFHGQEIINEGGTCFSLQYEQDFSLTFSDPGQFRADLLQDLILVQGVGEITRKKLKSRGYHSITDLLQHPTLRHPARRAIACISEGTSSGIMELAGTRHSRSHGSVLGAARLHEPEDFLFLDIETLGLFSRPVILFGIGCVENGHLVVHQYLVRDIAEEQAALIATIEHLSIERPALVTFNGKSFDLPYILDRLAYYDLRTPAKMPHFDVLHFSRRRWKNQLASLRLTALEREILGIRRDDDIPGQMVPEFYESYLRSGNVGPLVPIVEHNRQDIISLALLFSHLLEESDGRC